MKTRYSKHEYQEAKKVIDGAKIVNRFSSSTMRSTTYLTGDGQEWYEFESLLESPEDDYRLELLKAVGEEK